MMEDLSIAVIVFCLIWVMLAIYKCLKCAAKNTDQTDGNCSVDPRLNLSYSSSSETSPAQIRSCPGVFVVSGVTANGPIGPMTEVNSDLNYYGSDGRGNLLVTQDQQQFYVVNQTGQDQRTILVPIRTPTPPPSYTSIFGGDQQQNQAQLAPPFQ